MITEGRKYLLGIDASLDSMGVAIYNPATNYMELSTGDIFKSIAFINKNCKLPETVVVLENINLDKPLFGAKARISSLMTQYRFNKVTDGRAMSEVSSILMMAQSLGKSKAACDVILKMFKAKNVPVIEVAPSSRDRANSKRYLNKPLPVGMMVMPTKTTSHQFKTLTGHNGTSSEHARDATTLVWGKSMDWAENMLQVQLEGKLNKTAVRTTDGQEVIVKNGKFVILDTTKNGISKKRKMEKQGHP